MSQLPGEHTTSRVLCILDHWPCAFCLQWLGQLIKNKFKALNQNSKKHTHQFVILLTSILAASALDWPGDWTAELLAWSSLWLFSASSMIFCLSSEPFAFCSSLMPALSHDGHMIHTTPPSHALATPTQLQPH